MYGIINATQLEGWRGRSDMNIRTLEVRRMAPRANLIREMSLLLLGAVGVIAVLKLLGIIHIGSWIAVGIVAAIFFGIFLAARIRLSIANAELERHLNRADG